MTEFKLRTIGRFDSCLKASKNGHEGSASVFGDKRMVVIFFESIDLQLYKTRNVILDSVEARTFVDKIEDTLSYL